MSSPIFVSKGDILFCAKSGFSNESHWGVVVDIEYDSKSHPIKLTLLFITSKYKEEELCECYDCTPGCSKIELTKTDTTLSFIKISYLKLIKYEVKFEDCKCNTSITSSNQRITKRLRNILKTYNINV